MGYSCNKAGFIPNQGTYNVGASEIFIFVHTGAVQYFWDQKSTVSDEIFGLERNTTMQPDLEARLLRLNWISFTKDRDSFLCFVGE